MVRRRRYGFESVEVYGSKGTTVKDSKTGKYTGLTIWDSGTVREAGNLKLNIRRRSLYPFPFKIPKFPKFRR